MNCGYDVATQTWNCPTPGGPLICGFNAPLGKWICTGPVGSWAIYRTCVMCSKSTIQFLTFNPTCAPGYTLDAATGTCSFEAILPDPNQNGQCAPGWQLDPNTNLCVQLVPPGQQCPAGYAYDPATQCCSAGFSDPILAGSVPGAEYPLCAFGWTYQPADQSCFIQLGDSIGFTDCVEKKIEMGTCSEDIVTPPPPVVCTNPAQYNDNEPACKAAGCTWQWGTAGQGTGTCK